MYKHVYCDESTSFINKYCSVFYKYFTTETLNYGTKKNKKKLQTNWQKST